MIANELQNKFMDIVEKNHSTNTSLLQKYGEDYNEVVSELENNLDELCNVKARYSTLKSRRTLDIFFKDVTSRYVNRTKKLSLEFAEDVIESYSGLNKRMKLLFSDEGVSAKTLYHTIDQDNDVVVSSIKAKAENIDVSEEIITFISEKYENKFNRLFKLYRIKTIFWGVLFPILIFIGGISAIVLSIKDAASNIQYESNVIMDNMGIFIARQIKSGAFLKFNWAALGIKGAKFLGVLLIAWIIYFLVIKYFMKQSLYRKLEKSTHNVIKDFKAKRDSFKNEFIEQLISQMKEMDYTYLSRYKKLF